jgi:hypothetical protein
MSSLHLRSCCTSGALASITDCQSIMLQDILKMSTKWFSQVKEWGYVGWSWPWARRTQESFHPEDGGSMFLWNFWYTKQFKIFRGLMGSSKPTFMSRLPVNRICGVFTTWLCSYSMLKSTCCMLFLSLIFASSLELFTTRWNVHVYFTAITVYQHHHARPWSGWKMQ